jgi:hypothetical protein
MLRCLEAAPAHARPTVAVVAGARCQDVWPRASTSEMGVSSQLSMQSRSTCMPAMPGPDRHCRANDTQSPAPR